MSSHLDDPDRFDIPNLIKFLRQKNDDTTLPPPETSNIERLYVNNNNSNTLDFPVDLRKAVRHCKNHPISNFVSYNALSPSSLAFVSSLSGVSFPHTFM